MFVVFRSGHIINCRVVKGCIRTNFPIECCASLASNRRHLHEKRRENSLITPSLTIQNTQHWSNQYITYRNISLSSKVFGEPLKPSSKVEVTVSELKKKQDESAAAAASLAVPKELEKAVVKKTLQQKIVAELLHYYHGFRLLGKDIKISVQLCWHVLKGNTLTRREYRLLMRTVGDMFRLVPFSVFIIVPFMELLLPVFIKFFPGLLPSQFQTAKSDDKLKANLKVKMDMAKFLQQTLDDMSVQHKDHNSERAKEFSEWFHRIRKSGELVPNEEIMKFSKLFEDEITLDSLSRNQLIALCRVLEVQTLGTNNFLRFQLRMKLRSLAADDKMIQKEGVEALNLAEVQQACRARGMRAYGLTEDRLRSQLRQWLDLSLNEKVPPSLLLLSRALMLPETIPTSDKLKATISSLPESIVNQTKAAIGEKEGKIDNKVKLELLKEEERRIKEERLELKEEAKAKIQTTEKDKETLIDKAPILSPSSTPILEDTALKISAEKLEQVEKKEEHLQSQDFHILETAIDSVSERKKFIVEKGELQELKAEMADYKEDVENLKKVTSSQPKGEIRESKAAKRLYNSVNKMITKLDTVLEDLSEKELQLKKDLEIEVTQKKKEELLKIDDIMEAIKQIKNVPDQSRIDQITKVLRKMDDDQDGSVKVEDVLKVLEIIGKENVKLSNKQIDELIELLDKEEILEVEDKIEKALLKDKETKAAEKAARQAGGGDGATPKDGGGPSASADASKTSQKDKSEVKSPGSDSPPTNGPKLENIRTIPPIENKNKTKSDSKTL